MKPPAEMKHSSTRGSLTAASNGSSSVLYILLITLIVMAVDFPLIDHDFVNWDDTQFIVYNNSLLHVTSRSFSDVLTRSDDVLQSVCGPVCEEIVVATAVAAHVPKPSPYVSAFPTTLNPEVFHLVDILFHAANSVLVFLLIVRLVKSPPAAFVGALLFALHPMQVENVAWVCGITRPSGAFFSLLALIFYVRYLEKADEKTSAFRPFGYLALTLLFSVMAMLCKPVAIVLPLVGLVIDWSCFQRPVKNRLLVYSVWQAALMPLISVASDTIPFRNGIAVLPLPQRVIVASDALTFYLRRVFVPWPLVIDYGRDPNTVLHSPFAALALLTPIGLGAALWYWRRSRPLLAASTLIALLFLLPTLGLTPFPFQLYSTVADRYVYLAVFGIGLGVASALASFFERQRPATTIAAACVLATMAAMTIQQGRYWQDTPALMDHELSVFPASGQLINLVAYYSQVERPDLAVAATERQHRLLPANAETTAIEARAYLLDEKYDSAAAACSEALAIEPNNAIANAVLGRLSMRSGKFADAVSALEIAAAAPTAEADDENELGVCFALSGRMSDAAQQFQRAIDMFPDDTYARSALAFTEQQIGNNK